MSADRESPPPTEPILLRTVELFAAIAHPVRLAVLLRLSQQGAMTVGELQAFAGIEQSAMSHHLKLLRDRRLVATERRGKQIAYTVADRHVAHIVEDAVRHVEEGA